MLAPEGPVTGEGREGCLDRTRRGAGARAPAESGPLVQGRNAGVIAGCGITVLLWSVGCSRSGTCQRDRRVASISAVSR